MRTETKEVKIYQFNELSEEVQEKVYSNYRESNEFYHLSMLLKDELDYFMAKTDIKAVGDTEVLYSLSYCQGDGAMFTGKFEYNNIFITVTPSGHYYHEYMANFHFEDETGEEVEDNYEFINIYRDLCIKVKNSGYADIEHQNSEESIRDVISGNEYEFLADGTIY